MKEKNSPRVQQTNVGAPLCPIGLSTVGTNKKKNVGTS